MNKYTELVISSNEILFDSIIENLGSNNTHLLCDNSRKFKTINLLIVDCHHKDLSELVRRSKYIINIFDSSLSAKEIKYTKPIKLQTLERDILHARHDQFLFCTLEEEGNVIYDEQLSSLIVVSSYQNIILTDKESAIIKALITSPNNTMSKEDLLSNVWNYASNIDTSTVETHVYRLKGKIPEGIVLSISNNNIVLKCN